MNKKKKNKNTDHKSTLQVLGGLLKFEKKQRFSLTITLGMITFCILLAAVGMALLAIYIFSEVGLIGGYDDEFSIGTILGAMAIISVVIGGSLSVLLARFPLRPVNDLINRMNRLAAGDFKTRLQFKGSLAKHEAFLEITTSFNKLAEELENTEMLRSDFINNFSHEFKTPIVSIAGLAKLVNKGNLSDEQRAQYLTAIEEESLRLATMATNVLNLTKVENQTILSDVTSFNLSEQIRGCILLLENKWVAKDIDLQLEFDEVMIRANEELLKQVWINLADNAVKFSPKGGTVAIGITANASVIAVNISNAGEEISEENRKKIWNKFYQADESHASEGNGVGLAIVKRIVELHGGAVSVDCKDGNVTFSVKLPNTL